MMKDWKTTMIGCLLALAMAIESTAGMPDWLLSLARLAKPILVAALGYVASDGISGGDGGKKMACLAVLGLLLLGMTACRMTGFTLGLTGTPFGSLQVGCDGGVIGHPGGRQGSAVTNRNVNVGLVQTNLAR